MFATHGSHSGIGIMFAVRQGSHSGIGIMFATHGSHSGIGIILVVAADAENARMAVKTILLSIWSEIS
jgi:hypothetical protein